MQKESDVDIDKVFMVVINWLLFQKDLEILSHSLCYPSKRFMNFVILFVFL